VAFVAVEAFAAVEAFVAVEAFAAVVAFVVGNLVAVGALQVWLSGCEWMERQEQHPETLSFAGRWSWLDRFAGC